MEVSTFLKKKKKTKKIKKDKKKHTKLVDHPSTRPKHYAKLLHSMVCNYLSGLFGTGSPEELFARLSKTKDTDLKVYSATRSLFRNMAREMFGTWVPTIKLIGFATNLNTTGGSVFTNQVRFRASEIYYFATFGVIFDEYRPKGPIKFEVLPLQTQFASGTNAIYFLGVVDLVDGTALASVTEAMFYDTSKIFCPMINFRGNMNTEKIVWETRLMGQPDLAWLSTDTQTTDWCWFKTYNFLGTLAATTTYAEGHWVGEFEFRQLTGN